MRLSLLPRELPHDVCPGNLPMAGSQRHWHGYPGIAVIPVHRRLPRAGTLVVDRSGCHYRLTPHGRCHAQSAGFGNLVAIFPLDDVRLWSDVPHWLSSFLVASSVGLQQHRVPGEAPAADPFGPERGHLSPHHLSHVGPVGRVAQSAVASTTGGLDVLDPLGGSDHHGTHYGVHVLIRKEPD